MKLLTVAFSIIALAITSPAQTITNSQAPPNLEILSWSWRGYYNPLNRNYGSSITVDDTAAKERRAKRKDTTQGIVDPPTAPDPFMIGPGTLGGTRYGYLYTAVIKNVGDKTIKAISWDYVFANPDNQSIISRHQFRNTMKLRPGKEKKIKSLTIAEPIKVIDIRIIDRKLIERVIINSIEYSDGTVWHRH